LYLNQHFSGFHEQNDIDQLYLCDVIEVSIVLFWHSHTRKFQCFIILWSSTILYFETFHGTWYNINSNKYNNLQLYPWYFFKIKTLINLCCIKRADTKWKSNTLHTLLIFYKYYIVSSTYAVLNEQRCFWT